MLKIGMVYRLLRSSYTLTDSVLRSSFILTEFKLRYLCFDGREPELDHNLICDIKFSLKQSEIIKMCDFTSCLYAFCRLSLAIVLQIGIAVRLLRS